jgi:hypothetical protein
MVPLTTKTPSCLFPQVTPDMFSLPEFLLEPQVDDASLPQPPAGASAEPPAVPGAEEVQDMGAAIDAVASHVPLPKMLHDALSNCDPDIRKDMLQVCNCNGLLANTTPVPNTTPLRRRRIFFLLAVAHSLAVSRSAYIES